MVSQLIRKGIVKIVPFAVASAAMLLSAAPASAELHGTCAGCSDNGSITPMAIDPLSFGFISSPDKGTADFLLEVLIPNSVPGASTETISITGTNTGNASVTGSLFSSTAWTSGKLSAYLGGLGGLNSNPIDAFLTGPNPSTQTFWPTATGYFDYQFDFGSVTFGAATDPTFASTLPNPFSAPNGTIIVAFTKVCTTKKDVTTCDWTPTANSAALIETAGDTQGTGQGFVPEPITVAIFGAGLAGLGALRRRKSV